MRFENDEAHTERIIDALFPRDAPLCCGRSMKCFDTRPREIWRGELTELALMVPNAMCAENGRRKSDGELSAHTLDNTGLRRFLTIEFDLWEKDRDGSDTPRGRAQNGERNATRFLELYDCGHLTESFRRNKKESETGEMRRSAAETSTSIVFGATFNAACFQGQTVRAGMARRFLYSVAERRGCDLFETPAHDPDALESLATDFRRCLEVEGAITFAPDARREWRGVLSLEALECSMAHVAESLDAASWLDGIVHPSRKTRKSFSRESWWTSHAGGEGRASKRPEGAGRTVRATQAGRWKAASMSSPMERSGSGSKARKSSVTKPTCWWTSTM